MLVHGRVSPSIWSSRCFDGTCIKIYTLETFYLEQRKQKQEDGVALVTSCIEKLLTSPKLLSDEHQRVKEGKKGSFKSNWKCWFLPG